MKRNLLAVLSWFITIVFIFTTDALLRRRDPKFYEPRSDYTGAVTDGLFELLGVNALIVLPILCVLLIPFILWKQSRRRAVFMTLGFFILTVLLMPIGMLLYSCSTGIACI